MTIEPIPTNSVRVSSAVIIDTDELENKETKDNRSGNLWWEVPKSNTHKEEDIPEWLEDDKPIWEKADLACGCVVRNFWNCSNINRSNDDATIAGFDWGGLYVHCWLPNFDEGGGNNHQKTKNNIVMWNQTKKQLRRVETSK